MTVRDIMKYIESEYKVINLTPCEFCGGDYITEEIELALIDDIPFDICSCVCSNCGHEKDFEFIAPFIDEKHTNKLKKNLN